MISHASLDNAPVIGRDLRIRLRNNDPVEIGTGDTIRMRALLQRPSPPAYPGAWDLQRDAYFSGIGGYGTALGKVEVLAQAPPGGWQGMVQALRELIAARINGALTGTEAAIATTLLTGQTASIPPVDRAAFRDSGLAHLLAIAGLHIGIVMGLVFGAVRWTLALSERAALFWRLKAISAVAALLAGGIYLVLTGAHVPIQRSFAMACLVTLAVLMGRRAVSLRGLAVAMAVIVLISPNVVLGVSFQMSFSAVLALIAGYAAIRPGLFAWGRKGGRWRHIAVEAAMLALSSALAGTASTPYGAYHFGHIQLFYIAANLVAVPITASLVMPAGMIALLLMPLHLEAIALVPMGWGIDAILYVAHGVTNWPHSTVEVPPIPPWGLVVFSLGLAWLGIWRSRLRVWGVPMMIIGLFIAPILATPPDILVSADARLIAVSHGGEVALWRATTGDKFTAESWRNVWAQDFAALPCDKPFCTAPGHPDVLILRGKPPWNVCGAALLVSPEPLHVRCTPERPFVDRFTVWREGAQAVWLKPEGVVIVSDKQWRGERAWVLGPLTAKQTPAGSVPAPVENLD
jgi:competence protein ComEC